jgi:hypothetical protein
MVRRMKYRIVLPFEEWLVLPSFLHSSLGCISSIDVETPYAHLLPWQEAANKGG